MRHCLGLSGGTGRSFPRSSPDCTDLGLGRLTPQRAAQAAAPRIPVASTAGIAGCGRALTATVPRYPARGWVVGRRVGGCWVSMGVPEELSTSVLRRTAAGQQQQRTRARGVPRVRQRRVVKARQGVCPPDLSTGTEILFSCTGMGWHWPYGAACGRPVAFSRPHQILADWRHATTYSTANRLGGLVFQEQLTGSSQTLSWGGGSRQKSNPTNPTLFRDIFLGPPGVVPGSFPKEHHFLEERK